VTWDGAERRKHRGSLDVVLARLDERTKNTEKTVGFIAKKLEDFKDEFVTKIEFSSKFDPVRNAIYGFIGLLCTIVIGIAIYHVIP